MCNNVLKEKLQNVFLLNHMHFYLQKRRRLQGVSRSAFNRIFWEVMDLNPPNLDNGISIFIWIMGHYETSGYIRQNRDLSFCPDLSGSNCSSWDFKFHFFVEKKFSFMRHLVNDQMFWEKQIDKGRELLILLLNLQHSNCSKYQRKTRNVQFLEDTLPHR